MISMISSVGRNRELGKKNELVWRIPNDMKFFKEITMGHVVVMGRNTYDSIVNGLPGRKMIVLSFNDILGDVEVVCNIDDILNRYLNSEEEIFIIGGASVYSQFLKYTNTLYLTEIDATCDDADAFFPEFNKNEWDKIIIDSGIYNDLSYQICKYIRKNKEKII